MKFLVLSQKGEVGLTAWFSPWKKQPLLAEYGIGICRKLQAAGPIFVYEDTCFSSKVLETWTYDVNLTCQETESEYLSSCPTGECRVPCGSQLLRNKCCTEQYEYFWWRLEIEPDWKLRPACPHTSLWYTHQRPHTRLKSGQVQIFLSSVLRVHVHMKRT